MRFPRLFLALMLSCGAARADVPLLPPNWQPWKLAATPLPAEELGNRLDAIVTGTSPHPFSGAVLVAQGGNVVYFRALGQQRDVYGVNPGADSQYLVGSLTKQFTAALVLRQAELGKLDVNLPLRRYLPELAQDWAHEVTAAQLLNHTSGMTDPDRPLATPAGTRFAYNDRNYELLGMLLERVTGQPYAALAAGLFGECGMSDTLIVPQGEPVPMLQRRLPRLVTGYNEDAGGAFRIEQSRRGPPPAGGAVSTPQDLVRWNTCLHHGRVLGDRAYAAMIMASPNAVREGHRWGAVRYGYGLQVGMPGDLPEYSHNGNVGGFISTLLYYPRDRVSVVVLENTRWETNDMNRAMAAQDAVRAVVRGYLAGGRFNWRDVLH
jgi:D-alanyl-D-alanine carboxypeptidase